MLPPKKEFKKISVKQIFFINENFTPSKSAYTVFYVWKVVWKLKEGGKKGKIKREKTFSYMGFYTGNIFQ